MRTEEEKIQAHRKSQRKYYLKNKDKIKLVVRAYVKKNPERIKKIKRRYYERHRKRILQYQRDYRLRKKAEKPVFVGPAANDSLWEG